MVVEGGSNGLKNKGFTHLFLCFPSWEVSGNTLHSIHSIHPPFYVHLRLVMILLSCVIVARIRAELRSNIC